ncbi:MAG: Fic family protein [Alphaproteobacteria bacterium]|nr:Fic family protein [Alphaproteobacteria bacterium]
MSIKMFQAGTIVERYEYSSFEPNLINKPWELDIPQVSLLLSLADRKLGELNAFSQLIPDVNFFIKMHITKESTNSNKIEGTQTNIDESLDKIENIEPEKKDDWEEVNNYTHAINSAINNLNALPLSNRLIKQAHKILLQGVRGQHKMPGEFRKSQNWIGGNSIKNAKFVPPIHIGIEDYMYDLENFIHCESINLPHLIKVAILHYQFETIHPFLDGNGRVGRLLITLYLVNFGLLTQPTLYLSDFLEKNKYDYYENLSKVRATNDLASWLMFFLKGISETAESSIDTFKKIIELRAKLEIEIINLGKKQLMAKHFLQYLYGFPITDVNSVANHLNICFSTANRLINDFVKIGILIERTGNKRHRSFIFENYVKLFR